MTSVEVTMGENDPNQIKSLLDLPNEIIHCILLYLEAQDLARIAQTCRILTTLSYDERIWQPIVNSQLLEPVTSLKGPCRTFRELYLAHRPHWFLVRNKIWFSSGYPFGKLLVTHYDPETATISAYAVSAEREHDRTIALWDHDRNVIIHSFNPKITLDLERPSLVLSPDPSTSGSSPFFSPEVDMTFPASLTFNSGSAPGTPWMDSYLRTSFLLTHALPPAAITPSTQLWPPLRITAESRTRDSSQDNFRSAGHIPPNYRSISTSNFRLRQSVNFTGMRHDSRIRLSQQQQQQQQSQSFVTPPSSSSAAGAAGIGSGIRGNGAVASEHMNNAPGTGNPSGGGGEGGATIMQTLILTMQSVRDRAMRRRATETVSTYGTTLPEAYTPTAEKPYQGVFCGDYSGHGCEFLLITQPDKGKENPLPEGMDWLGEWFFGRDDEGSDGRGDGEEGEEAGGDGERSFESASEEIDEDGGETTEEDDDDDDDDDDDELGALIAPPTFTVDVPEGMAIDYPDVPSGRLEAIKLTGDPNVPVGEYTFIAPEIGHDGFIRVADEAFFKGARVVRSAGHVAGTNFSNDRYCPSQLIMISHDTLAQFWEGFGHISYYQRVNLDTLTPTR